MNDEPPQERHDDDEPTQPFETRPIDRGTAEDAFEDPGVEPIDKIVFAPAPIPSPAPRTLAGRPEPVTLSRRRLATLEAFAQAMIPPGGAIPHSASDVGVAERIDRAAGSFDASSRTKLERALAAWEWLSVLTRAFRPFSRLPAPVAVGVVERAARSVLPQRRRTYTFLKELCVNEWASTSPVEQAIGFAYSCVSSEPPQRGPALEVLGFRDLTRDHSEECDVVVVGSGAGGSVVAKELAEVGLSVLVIEEGSLFGRDDFAGPPLARERKLYRGQAMLAARGAAPVPLLLGRGVGGSTLVGAGTCYRTPDDVLRAWGGTGIEGLEPETMRPFFERVERIIHAGPVPEELLGGNANVFRRGADRVGVETAVAVRAISGCRGCGVCTFGCPSDAKQATHLNYLPRAQHHGAGIVAECRTEHVIVEDGRARGVVARMIDPSTGTPGPTLRVRAKIVVIAAGAIHTPALLQRNALGNRSGRLGAGLRVNPAARVVAEFPDDVMSWRGTQQALYSDSMLASNGVLVQAVSITPGTAASVLPGSGAGVKEHVAHLSRFAGADVFVADTSSGRVRTPGTGDPVVTYRLNKRDTRVLAAGVAHVADVMLAAGASAVYAGLPGAERISNARELAAAKEASVRPGGIRVRAQHPVGTAAMGVDPATSVVDPWGETHDVKGLFLADGSILPGCPGVGPMVTIMGLATRAADHIARERETLFG